MKSPARFLKTLSDWPPQLTPSGMMPSLLVTSPRMKLVNGSSWCLLSSLNPAVNPALAPENI